MVPPPTGGRRRERVAAPPPVDWVLAGRAFVHGRLQPVEIGIDAEGFVTRVARHILAKKRHDVGDQVILPSATDLHVHLREPGGPETVENFDSGTRQAALAGVGLVGDMPNTDPPITTSDRVVEKVERARRRISVDLLVYAAANGARTIESLGRVAGAFKLYLAPTTGIDTLPDPGSLRELLARIAKTRLALSVHAEAVRDFRTTEAARNPLDWGRHRPEQAELDGLEQLLPAPESLRLHVAHVTTSESVDRLRLEGHSFEASPHHLLLAAGDQQDSRFKVNPPLRTEQTRRRLFDRFAAGEIPCLASDHAPHPLTSKELPFDRAPAGVPGLETLLPLFLNQVRRQRISFPTLLRAACDRPARWFGAPQGRIAPGHCANLIVVDFRVRTPIASRTLSAPCGWTPFEGWEGIFPREHYLRGERIVENGEHIGGPVGRVVRPEYARTLGSED